jgi:hypothetical protein
MKAITLHQPWASLVGRGKSIETRSWFTPHRGPVAIHAAASVPAYAIDAMIDSAAMRNALIEAGCIEFNKEGMPRKSNQRVGASLCRDALRQLPLGAVVATCRLVACKCTSTQIRGVDAPCQWVEELSDTDRACGDFGPYRFGWFLEDIQILPEPIPVKGMQGLWEWRQ